MILYIYMRLGDNSKYWVPRFDTFVGSETNFLSSSVGCPHPSLYNEIPTLFIQDSDRVRSPNHHSRKQTHPNISLCILARGSNNIP